MVKHELSINIDRPVEEVFAFVSDLKNGPRWQPGLFEVRALSNEKFGIGSKFASVRKFLGQKIENIVEIITYEPFRKLVIKSDSGSAPFEESYIFESTAAGTKLSTVLDLYPSGLMGLAEPIIAGGLKREMSADFENLKILLEKQVLEVAN